MKTISLLILALGLCGCGPRAFIEVTVRSVLSVPDAADSVELAVFDGDDEVARQSLALVQGDDFPLTIVLEPSSDTGSVLEVFVRALLLGEEQAAGAARLRWEAGRVNTLALDLTPLATLGSHTSAFAAAPQSGNTD